MNVNQIINMIIKLVMRKAINKGIDAGIKGASNMVTPKWMNMASLRDRTDAPGRVVTAKGTAKATA